MNRTPSDVYVLSQYFIHDRVPGVHHGKMQAGGLSDLQLSTLFDRMTIHFNDSYVINID